MSGLWSKEITAPAINSGTMLRGMFLFGLIFLASEISFEFYFAPAVFPLHAGFALAGLVLLGIEYWPAIFAAILLSHFLHGSTPLLSLAFALGNSIQAITGAFILNYIQFKPSLRRMRDIFGLTFVALMVSTIMPAVRSGVYGVESYLGVVNTESVPFDSWWVGHMFSLLIVAPFLIRWFAHPRFSRSGREIIEIIAAFLLLWSVFFFLFFTSIEQVRGIPLVYMIFPPLFWIALRLGSRFMTLAIIGMGIIALAGTALGYATDQIAVPRGELLFLTQIFIVVIAVIFLIVTAVEEERRTAARLLRSRISDLQNALSQIRSEESTKDTFVATLAHELRNPLAPLLSTIELITIQGPETKDFPSMLSMMRDRVKTMARLLDDLLDISRISHQKLELKKVDSDISVLVRRSVQGMEEYMRQRKLHFNLTLPQEERPIVYADPIRIEQIIVNLLHNAAKYTPEGGTIDLILTYDVSTITLLVRDTGIGIPEHMLSKIFDPFLQLNAQHTGGGLGIGLTLTRRLVEMHGGTITAQSRGEGHGSEFTVILPLRGLTRDEIPAPPEPAISQRVSAPAIRILIVDDNEAATMTMAKLLQFKGYEVATAINSSETFVEVTRFKPHVIMLDIGLPDMDGYEIARKLRTDYSYTSTIIALTGYGQESDKERTKEAGFDIHLTKPVGITELERVLSRLVIPASPIGV